MSISAPPRAATHRAATHRRASHGLAAQRNDWFMPLHHHRTASLRSAPPRNAPQRIAPLRDATQRNATSNQEGRNQLMEQWISDTQRCDGLYIHKRATEAWSIRTANDALVTDLCPCCGKPFLTARAARLVADFLFPIPANLDDGNPPEAA